MYDELEVPLVDAVYSEFEIFFEVFQKEGYCFYLLNGFPASNTVFTREEKTYLQIDKEEKYEKNTGYSNYPNICFVKQAKLIDMRFLENLVNIKFIFFIPKLNNRGVFYYNLVLGYLGEHSLDPLTTFHSELTKLGDAIPMAHLDINFDYLQKLFNFENNIFREVSLTKEETDKIIELQRDFQI